MSVPVTVIELIERFGNQVEMYKSGKYNETQVRVEYIDPMFEALGWDIYNKKGLAPTYQDVIHEDIIKIGVETNAPDYCFRVGGTRKFFLEAKKPAINIKDNIGSAFQIRRYAWSAKLPLSILTDFEEFAVYDCRIKPHKGDKPSVGRVFYCKYDEYATKWNEIESIFSKDAVLKGSFDKFAESNRKKKGTTEVDDSFLEEIESWRVTLAKNLALRNPKLSVRELNYAVQQTIDRIIFLRICEDRGIEPYGRLRNLLNNGDIYNHLTEQFRIADDRYNSGLFHFKDEKDRPGDPDKLTLSLSIDDDALNSILKTLYYPDSPYEFSVLPADILGQVYEQFLGKIIRLTANHHAKIEEKPEVKKAHGVYYTPKYIVDYAVSNTVGALIESKTPSQISKLRILDPACGSGSFLIQAYQCLLNWHRDWYSNHDPERHAKGKNASIYKSQTGEWLLTIYERKRILLNNIYGVDIDDQAVEVTKLSLLLKVLEGQNPQTLTQNYEMFRERALPDLQDNIKCGNSLIQSDYYEGQLIDHIGDEDEHYRVNAFDWHTEFRAAFEMGGFDIVIGNPPYTYLIAEREQEYFDKYYKNQNYQKDLYLLFLERYSYLLRSHGLLGIIVSNTWLQSVTLTSIRKYLTQEYIWRKVLLPQDQVFKAIVDTHVLIFEYYKGSRSDDQVLNVEKLVDKVVQPAHRLKWELIPKDGCPINIAEPTDRQELFKRIQIMSHPLSNFCDVYNGIKPFEKGKGTPPQTEEIMKTKPYVSEGKKPGDNWSPLLRGSLIHKYKLLWNNDYWVLYGPWLAAPRDPAIFSASDKIMIRQTGDSLIATIISAGFIARNNLHILIIRDKAYSLEYILGIINSRLLNFAYGVINPERGEPLAEVKKQHVEILPMHPIDFSIPDDKARHDRIVSLVIRNR
ncbi:MAG TPA: TaqI-like C-terminal specificity domain-containing protein [Candidatus Acidoferrales bacterium]|nr:TaqI-like C-terminal specificity domain-containing protein [Candidatus Acidoferrales bacterium]